MISVIAIWVSVMIIYVPTYPSTQRDMVPFALINGHFLQRLWFNYTTGCHNFSQFVNESKEVTTLKRCELSSVFCSQLKETEREYFLGKDFVLDVGLSFNSKSKSEDMCEISFCVFAEALLLSPRLLISCKHLTAKTLIILADCNLCCCVICRICRLRRRLLASSSCDGPWLPIYFQLEFFVC